MLTKLSIKRPVTTFMIVMMVVLGGVLGYMNTDLAYMPDMNFPIALVSASYSGAGPEEMEELVTKPIEGVLSTITGVDTLTSVSGTGSSMVLIQFVDGTDLDMAAIDMREKIDMIKDSLPEDATEPRVMKMDMNAETIEIGITSQKYNLNELYELLDNQLTSQFEKIEGVSSVDMIGGIEKEVQVIVNQDKLNGYGLSMNQISAALSRENVNIPSGSIKQGNIKLQLRTVGQFKSVEDIANLPITTANGAMIYLKDIATIKETEKTQETYALINGVEGITYSLSKQSDSNVVKVTEAVKKAIDRLGQQHPDLEITLLSTTGEYIQKSVSNISQTAFLSALVAVLVLLVILRDFKTSLIIGISIPTSVITTFALMYVKGMTLNTISMGGIVIGIGMLVDNSVVVLENIFKYFNEGMDAKEAAEKGTKEVSMAVLASTLTTVAVFLPLAFTSGIVGEMMSDLSFSICFALGASYIVSITVVPMACSLLLKRSNKPRNKFMQLLDKWGGVLDALDRGYRRLLKSALAHRILTLVIILGVFIASLATIPLAGMDMMPTADEGQGSISITMPDGSLIEDTKSVLMRVLEKIEGIEEIEMTAASISSSDAAYVSINLVDMENRKRSTDEVCKDIEKRLKDIAGCEIKVTGSSAAMGQLANNQNISVNILGDDMETLTQVNKDVMALLSTINGASNIESTLEESLVEANIVVNRAKAAKYGISTSDIANVIYSSISGMTATTYKVNGSEIDVVVKYDDNRTNYMSDLESLTIKTATGTTLPITEVIDIVTGQSVAAINRENQHKYITITGGIDGVDTNTAQKLVEEKLKDYIFPEGCSYSFSGITEMMNEAFSSLGTALIVAVLLIYMIMASQFESFGYPFIIMFCMPIALTGGVLGLFVTGNTISSIAFMGFIMLVGMVVNNGIVLVDYTNQLIRDHGMDCKEALLTAGPSRLRPILMTTLTTVIGLIPMAFGTTEGMEIQQPLGITVIFGLTLSTMITLVLIPVLYSLLTGLKRRVRLRLQAKENMNVGLEG